MHPTTTTKCLFINDIILRRDFFLIILEIENISIFVILLIKLYFIDSKTWKFNTTLIIYLINETNKNHEDNLSISNSE